MKIEGDRRRRRLYFIRDSITREEVVSFSFSGGMDHLFLERSLAVVNRTAVTEGRNRTKKNLPQPIRLGFGHGDGSLERKEEMGEVMVVFTRENRGGSAQHETRATPTRSSHGRRRGEGGLLSLLVNQSQKVEEEVVVVFTRANRGGPVLYGSTYVGVDYLRLLEGYAATYFIIAWHCMQATSLNPYTCLMLPVPMHQRHWQWQWHCH